MDSAVSPDDYTDSFGTVQFAPGETVQTIEIDVLGDTVDEFDETFEVYLSTSSPDTTLADPLGVGTIQDNDPTPSLSINDVTVDEWSGTASLTVSLSGNSEKGVSVDYDTSDGTATDFDDYFSALGSLTFDSWQTEQTIDISIADDMVTESDEYFFVNLSNPANAGISDGQGQVTIEDDDSSIGDLVWDDLNGDGIQDAGEPGLDGVTVDLLDEFSGWLDSTTTDASGFYEFTGLSAGNYQLQFYEPMDYAFSSQDQGTDDTVDSDADAFGLTAVFALGVNEDKDDVDAGLSTPTPTPTSGPEIEVGGDDGSGGDTELIDGMSTVDFGSTETGESVLQVIAIENTGDDDLLLDTASLTVPDGFSVGLLFDTTVAPSDWTVFSLQLDASEVGSYGGVVSFNNNDSDENPFDITISGVVTEPVPEIELMDESMNDVEDETGNVGLGETFEGVPIQYTFDIHNSGTANLTLDTSTLVLPAGFSVVSLYDALVAPFSSTDFTIQLDASAVGLYGGELSFDNNDSDENPYNFHVSGNVVDPPALSLDLDADDSSGATGADFFNEWIPGLGPVAAQDVLDATIQSQNPDLSSLTVTITDLIDVGNELLSADTTGTLIVQTYDGNTGTLTLSGVDSVYNYEQVLRTVSYDNTAPNPSGFDRTIQFQADDGINISNPANTVVLLQVADGNVTKVEFVPKSKLFLNGIPYANRYGKLELGTNPDGDVSGQNNVPDGNIDNHDKLRNAFIEPLFEGGDRFFPDAAGVTSVNVGQNVVRVRAFVDNLDEGDIVLFRSFDVDDPSTEQNIDTDGNDGSDNRGRLAGLHTPAASHSPSHNGFHGRLRPVNGGNNLGQWGGAGAIVEAEVKTLIDNNGNVVNNAQNQPILVAEADLFTTYAPGDNYRVAALPESRRAALVMAHTRENGNFRIPTSGGNPQFITPQLSIWRYLHVENDSSVNVYGLMQTGTVNRQDNRYADAYIEPVYDVVAANNTSAPATGRALLMIANGDVLQNDDLLMGQNGHRQSAGLERPTFWVVYVTNGFTSPAPDELFSMTLNNTAVNSYEASVIFTTAIADKNYDSCNQLT
ncbi:MAG: choice-of-anchor D domain-containing protein [Planctomycetes bacterium]|nr:choice-of-anchor D domain-containing protein [Planctomycetota bacterium]